MRAARAILAVFGVLAILMGLLWIGQGTGIVMWPASSFMLADRQWAVNGAVLAVIGAAALWFARR
ncbi:hypothetical protein ACOYW6_03820 [Parablastomonas sp. CN1-191]|uniref:hypothetical protein n=1 Tax=Parablastomonas sp. CN1-191 TaxID=3400908 RepID=UPI003BF7D8C8